MPIINQPGASGGGSSPSTREYFYTGDTAVPTGTYTKLPWTYSIGDALLDLTDPTQPTMVTAGVYAFSVEVDANGPLGTPWAFQAELDVDASGEDALINASAVNAGIDAGSAGTGPMHLTLPLTWHVPAGGVCFVIVRHNLGSDMNCQLVAAVQRLS